jgi:hypothetical protein
LFGAKIRSVKDLLQAEDLYPFFPGFFNQGNVFFDHGLFDFGGSPLVLGVGGLDMGTFDNSGHISSLR